MRIRIQPKDIEIPEDEPFKYDLLDRKEPAEILTNLVGSIEGPCVLAIDAAWGNGKTTFLELWSQHLRNNHFPVVELNAWKTDYVEDPFTALSIEWTDGLKQHADKDVIDSVKEGAIEVLRQLTPDIFRMISNSIPGGGALGPEIGDIIARFAENRFTTYGEARDSVQGFKKKLQTMAKKVSEDHENKPVLIMVDELDRCRPSYAVELLEVAKHLFSADRIIFVLAINRTELSHSVKALYGQDFDANGYLKRFIDIDFVLPEPDRRKFISSHLKQTNIEAYIQRVQDNEARRKELSLIETFMGDHFNSSCSLRQISQAIHRIGLVLASLPMNSVPLVKDTVVALILRIIHEDIYHRFRMGEATDLEVVDTVFPGREHSVLLNKPARCEFETIIILGYQEIMDQPSVLLEMYREIAAGEPDDDISKKYRNHAKFLSTLSDPNHHVHFNYRSGLEFAMSRIELFSTELKGDTNPSNRRSG